MLNQYNATKNRIVDHMTAQERMKAIQAKRDKQKVDYYTNIKYYIQRKEQGGF